MEGETHEIARALDSFLDHASGGRSLIATMSAVFFCRLLCLVFCQSFLEIRGRFKLGLFAGPSSAVCRRVARSSASLSFCLGILLEYALVVRLDNLFRNALHAKDLYLESRAIRQGILNDGQRLLVDLLEMDVQAASSVEASAAAIAFVVLGLLMIDQDFEVIEIALTIVAPRSREDLVDLRVLPLVLPHPCKK